MKEWRLRMNGMNQQTESGTRFITAKVDIESMFYKEGKYPKVYAWRGERLAVVSDRGNVLIVENSKGEKFPINKNEIR